MKFKVRKILAFLWAVILIKLGFVKRKRQKALKGEYILSICFHDPSKKLFQACIRWLQKYGFSFISVHDLLAITTGEKIFPKGAVVITVDDGWAGNLENIVTIAEMQKIPVTIFLPTEPIENGVYWWSYIEQANLKGLSTQSVEALKLINNDERLKIVNEIKSKISLKREAMTICEIKELSESKYVSFGSHTVTHPILPMCDKEKAIYELSESKRKLESWLKKGVNYFAFPNGDYTNRDIDMLMSLGYKIAFTTQPQYITPENVTKPLVLPRFEIYEKGSFEENICRMAGVWFNKLPLSF